MLRDIGNFFFATMMNDILSLDFNANEIDSNKENEGDSDAESPNNDDYSSKFELNI